MILVKHLVDIQGVRFLYTKKILELIYNHFVKGFDYRQFRKTDYRDHDACEYDNKKINLQFGGVTDAKKSSTQGEGSSGNRLINFNKLLQKEALVAIRLQQAQINF